MQIRKILFIFVLFVSQITIPSFAQEEPNQNIKETTCVAKVEKILNDITQDFKAGDSQRSQELSVRILSGKDKGKKRVVLNMIPTNPAFAIVGEVGKKYIISKVEDEKTGNEEYFLTDYYRESYIHILVAVFFILLLLIAGMRGVRTIFSLFLTILCIAFILLPSIEKGINPIFSAVFTSLLATGFTMVIVAGWNVKSLAATVGTAVGVLFSGIIANWVIYSAPLSGLSNSEATILWANNLFDLNFKGLLAAGMIVSCLGAIMDVGISVASAIQEIKIANPTYGIKELFTAGMNIGKDIIGTMTNTLVLAYTGMALPLLLLIKYQNDPMKFLNLELVVSEITATIAGSIGLLIAVPVTAIFMSVVVSRGKINKI